MKSLDCVLIGVCAVIRSNMVIYCAHNLLSQVHSLEPCEHNLPSHVHNLVSLDLAYTEMHN